VRKRVYGDIGEKERQGQESVRKRDKIKGAKMSA